MLFCLEESMKYLVNYFSKVELALWAGSVAAVLAAFLMFDRSSWITLAASLIGVTSLIFAAKGHPAAQAMAIVFALLYGWISWGFAYYGEMITYLGMSMPMAVFSLISWIRHPSDKKDEVKVNHLKAPEYVFMAVLTIAVTVGFYFILKHFNTANLIPSTISVTTSFAAVYFVFRRSQLYAVAYAANDVVLVVLWVMAAAEDVRYISVVVCFLAFLVNDIYGFINWRKMARAQEKRAANAAYVVE